MEQLIAAAGHGLGMHGPIGLVILIALVVIALGAVLVRAIRVRKRAAEPSGRDRGRGGGA